MFVARLPMTLCALPLLAGCSIDFDTYLRAPDDAGPRVDLGVSPTDTGPAPTDTGPGPTDTGPAPTDTGPAPTDTGPAPTVCTAPVLVAVTENLANNSAFLLRWSFADDRRCADLPLTIAHPRAVGVAFNNISDVSGPQLVVVNEDAVSIVDPGTGAVIRDVPSSGAPRSVFDIVSNGSGTFAVAYTFAGSSIPGTVGNVRVFDHRANNLREVQTWNRNAQFSINALWMTAFPGNQGQYLTVRPPDTGSGQAVFVTSPSGSGFHPLSMPPFIAARPAIQSVTAYRTVDRRGHYAIALSGSGTPVVYIATSEVSASSVRDVFVPSVRCGDPCPTVLRAVAFPDENDQAAGLCERSGTEYAVVRFGGGTTGCAMLDTTALPGRWRINDLAVLPR